ILRETSFPNPAGFCGLFHHSCGTLFCVSARHVRCRLAPGALLDLHCDIHFQPLPADGQLLVLSSLVAIVGRTVLRRMAVAGFLSADEMAQENRSLLDSRRPGSAP